MALDDQASIQTFVLVGGMSTWCGFSSIHFVFFFILSFSPTSSAPFRIDNVHPLQSAHTRPHNTHESVA